TKLSTTKLQAGDVLLLHCRKDRLVDLKQREGFVVVSDVGLPGFRRQKLFIATSIIAGVVATAALNLLPIVVAAIAGCITMILSRCLTLEEAYEAIDWKVIFLLAGVLTLGIALERSGVAVLAAETVISVVGDMGPIAVLSAFYLITTLLSEAMSNNASAALIAPIAISAAEAIGVSPRPFLFAVAFAASSSFMTPVGYQTNTMIYGVGQYKYLDFVKVGTPLNLLLWALATFMIPVLWPFE
ncbi:MAG: anion permease, partial [Ignavibacteriales bacterium]|nr:anion permease [Ignavibacteriales bacterium]